MTMLLLGMTLSAQDKPKTPNVTRDLVGNFMDIQDKKTGNKYTNKEGKIFDVYVTSKGKYYAITGVSKKTGKPTRKYLVF